MSSEPFSEDKETSRSTQTEGLKSDTMAQIVPVERKLQIVMTEWNFVQDILEKEMDRKTKVRTWAVTAFSAIFALSMHQSNENIVLLIIPAVMLCWFIDATYQGTHGLLVERSRKIEELLQNATDSAILAFRAPEFGHHLSDRRMRDVEMVRSFFRRLRVVFYGSMILGATIMYVILSSK